jgi:type VI secretion system secreted protein VgrG
VRVALPLASKNRGFSFVPGAGDEVLVAFEGGDPDRPIIVGSVRNPATPPILKLPNNRDALVWAASTRVSIVERPDSLTFTPSP